MFLCRSHEILGPTNELIDMRDIQNETRYKNKGMCVNATLRLFLPRLYHNVTYLTFSVSRCVFSKHCLHFWWIGNHETEKKTDREWDRKRYRRRQKEWKKVQLTLLSLSHSDKQIISVIQCITCQVIPTARFVHWWKWYAHFINSIFVSLFIYACLWI